MKLTLIKQSWGAYRIRAKRWLRAGKDRAGGAKFVLEPAHGAQRVGRVRDCIGGSVLRMVNFVQRGRC